MLLLLNKSVGEMTGDNVKKLYQIVVYVEFNTGTLAGWRNGSAKGSAESCSWGWITSCSF